MKSFDDVRRPGGSFGVLFSRRGMAASAVVALVAIAACSSNKSTTTAATPLLCQMPVANIADAAAWVDAGAATCAMASNGITNGPTDMHCDTADAGEVRQVTEVAGCCGTTTVDAGGPPGEACTENEAGIPVSIGPDDGTCCESDYNPTMYGQEGSDDDCKYDVSWTSTPICEGMDVYFTVHATLRVGATTFQSGAPLTGAGPYIQANLNCSGVASARQPPPIEFKPGWYEVGPINFPDPGMWSVRFHFNENCNDELPDSPHGHAAFWVTVPGATDAASGPLPEASSEASPSGASDASSDASEQ